MFIRVDETDTIFRECTLRKDMNGHFSGVASSEAFQAARKITWIGLEYLSPLRDVQDVLGAVVISRKEFTVNRNLFMSK
jgi:hypothetical protein